MNDQNVLEALKLIQVTLRQMEAILNSHVSQIDKQEKQIGRLIQCIGEFDLNKQQRYYLNKAIWGGDDDK